MNHVELPWGSWHITAVAGGITEVLPGFSDKLDSAPELTRLAAEQLLEYAAGKREHFTVPLLPEGTEFQRLVWSALQQVPYGESITYGQLARRIGRPSAVRAVARAVGANPCLVFIPCHRVLGHDGSLTGFSAGLALKRDLLQLEGIPFKDQ